MEPAARSSSRSSSDRSKKSRSRSSESSLTAPLLFRLVARATSSSSALVACIAGSRRQRRSASTSPPAPTTRTSTGSPQTTTPSPSPSGLSRIDSPKRSTYSWRMSSSSCPSRIRRRRSARIARALAVDESATDRPSQSGHRSSVASSWTRSRADASPSGHAAHTSATTTTAASSHHEAFLIGELPARQRAASRDPRPTTDRSVRLRSGRLE